jgi:hypothetical protein
MNKTGVTGYTEESQARRYEYRMDLDLMFPVHAVIVYNIMYPEG